MRRLAAVSVIAGLFLFGSITSASAGWHFFLPPVPVPVPVFAPPVVRVEPAPVYGSYYGGYYGGYDDGFRARMHQAGYSDGYSDGYNYYQPAYRYDNRPYRVSYNRGWDAGRDRRLSEDNSIRYYNNRGRGCGHHDGGWDRD